VTVASSNGVECAGNAVETGVGTRVAVADSVVGTTVSGTIVEVVGGTCCSTAVALGTTEGVLADVGAVELDVQPDVTISIKNPTAVLAGWLEKY
jgi:hypothetical protein